ncbi:hypothetical protein PXD04_10685 [Methanosphaera sp. ISO3-F5]|uniref:hypothetical protein n=1 Tax=Methanosphaera sp. ISO3-F5 TaxID=1452353 RepID=UPI002B25D433|nr:hypothetical protein [Methanosphaera sp. ISO3-F5]WQH64158.1 hypothetical protein PXD04_10685 [Methanosphaera sp. ISO3-F5]
MTYYIINGRNNFNTKQLLEKGIKSIKEDAEIKKINLYQFINYDLYENEIFTEEHKRKVKEEQFPKDLENTYNYGVTIAGGENNALYRSSV